MTAKTDKDMDDVLRGWANEAPRNAAFVAALTAIPAQYPQRRRSVFKRIIGAMGGWGFATPQLAGLAIAAWLGVATGSQADVQEDLVTQAMGQHIFGVEESYEG